MVVIPLDDTREQSEMFHDPSMGYNAVVNLEYLVPVPFKREELSTLTIQRS